MIFIAKPILDCLRGVDPLIFLAPVCLGLGASFVMLFMELEKTRMRWLANRTKRRLSA